MSVEEYNSHESERKLNEQRGYLVVKSNDLIQKSRFQLSLQEQKVILYLISKIKPEDMELQEHIFQVTEFCDVCGIDRESGKNYKNVKDTIKTLADKSLWVMLEDDTETLVRWINKAWVNKKSGIIKIRLDDDMKPYLLNLQERFTQYELLYILAMRSQYSIRLYELLKSFEYQRKHSYRFDIDELKKRLDAQSYERFPDFKRYVLEIAMREINDLSDIKITCTPIKKGKRYATIEFTVKAKQSLDERMKAWKKINDILNPPQISLFEKAYDAYFENK